MQAAFAKAAVSRARFAIEACWRVFCFPRAWQQRVVRVRCCLGCWARGKCATQRCARARLCAILQEAERCAHGAAAGGRGRVRRAVACTCVTRRTHPVTGSTSCTLDTCKGASMVTMPPSCCLVRFMCFFTCTPHMLQRMSAAHGAPAPGARTRLKPSTTTLFWSRSTRAIVPSCPLSLPAIIFTCTSVAA